MRSVSTLLKKDMNREDIESPPTIKCYAKILQFYVNRCIIRIACFKYAAIGTIVLIRLYDYYFNQIL